MQRDSAEQHKNHISNLMSNEIDELEDRKNALGKNFTF